MGKKKSVAAAGSALCPCGSQASYDNCCGRYLDQGQSVPSAEALLRSRYTAYTLLREPYLLQSWHASTRPAALGLADEVATQWLGLEVKCHPSPDPDHAVVELVVRHKVNGRALRFNEISRFVCEDGQWFYVDGDIQAT